MTKQEKARKFVNDLGFDSVEDLIAALQSIQERSQDEKKKMPEKAFDASRETEISLEIKVKGILRRMEAPTHIKGYQYTADALVMGIKDKGNLDGITKSLYPAVAEKNKTTDSRVERAIRHFINDLYVKGNLDEIEKVVAKFANRRKGIPTNSEFIFAFVDYIRMGGE